jgi:hypothetical protein
LFLKRKARDLISASNVLSTPATINDTYTNYRLKLNSLERKDATNPGSIGQKWTFDYNPPSLPGRRSFAQDHWGYYNGATANTTLICKQKLVAWVVLKR